MPETIRNLLHKYQLAHQPDTDSVRRKGNSYAELDGKIIALSLSGKDDLNELLLDESCSALEHLYLNDNTHLEKVAFSTPLPRLKMLYLSRCGLTDFRLPAGCHVLEQLYIANNQLATVELEGDCPELKLLDVSNNQLTTFSLSSGYSKLSYIYLQKNQLSRLSFAKTLPSLAILHLASNELSELPAVDYPNLETLYVKGNPLRYEESLIEGDQSGNAVEIISILRAASRSGVRPNFRAKMIIVGNGRIGKTCIVNRLLGLACADDQAYTHAISIQHLNSTHLPGVKTTELDLQVWDFGGQDVYFATHQFFLSEEALYIYAWTDEAIARKNRENDKKTAPAMYDNKWQSHHYWLDNIRMHGEKSPVLIVKTHCLETKETLPYEELQGKYDLSYAPLDFDAKSSEERYLTRLKEELAAAVNALPLLGSNIPNSYNDLIYAIRYKKAQGLSELSQFAELATENNIEDVDLEALLGYLKKTGEIIYFSDKDSLKERIFISPEILIGKVYKLLENNSLLLKQEGVFTKQYAREVFGWGDCDMLLDLLIKFEVVFEKRTGDAYIAPQYLPSVPVSGNAFHSFEGHKVEKVLRFTLHYPGLLPENVMVNVLSKYGPYAQEVVYRNGIYFIKEGTHEGCVIVCHESSRHIRVYTTENESADTLAKEVFEQFLKHSKKATIHISADEQQWVDVQVAKDAFEKDKDIPLIAGGWLEQKETIAYLFETHQREFSPKVFPLHPVESKNKKKEITKPEKDMPATSKNLIIGGIIFILAIILMIPIVQDGRGGKISILGNLLNWEVSPKPVTPVEPQPNPHTTTSTPEVEKVSVIGRITINDRKATRNDIKEVFVKNDNLVNRESLSGDQFTLKEVEIPKDKRLDIAFTFPDDSVDSRVFNVSNIREGKCDIGEIRITVKQTKPTKTGGPARPVYIINNGNIIQGDHNSIQQ